MMVISEVTSSYSYKINNSLSENNILYAQFVISFGETYNIVLSPLSFTELHFNDIILIKCSITNKSNSKINMTGVKLSTVDNLALIPGTLINSDNKIRYNTSDFLTTYAMIGPINPAESINIQFNLKINPIFEEKYVKSPICFSNLINNVTNTQIVESPKCTIILNQPNIISTEVKPFNIITLENTGNANSNPFLYKCIIPSGTNVSNIIITAKLDNVPIIINKRILGSNMFLSIPSLPSSTAQIPHILEITIRS